MKVRISSEALAAIRAHAAADPAREVCGLLLGQTDHVTAVTPALNVAPHPSRHFEIDPVALFAAIRAERAGGSRLVGYYHSHPHGSAWPSQTDRASAAADGKLWVIVADEVRAWRSLPNGFVQVKILES
jgi:proteasome lid subunit RPN8/RPN11